MLKSEALNSMTKIRNRWEDKAAVSIVDVEVEVAEGNRGSGDSVIAKPAYHFQIRCLR